MSEVNGVRSFAVKAAMGRLEDTCPPPRTEAEVATEALAVLRENVARGEVDDCLAYDEEMYPDAARLRALAKELTR